VLLISAMAGFSYGTQDSAGAAGSGSELDQDSRSESTSENGEENAPEEEVTPALLLLGKKQNRKGAVKDTCFTVTQWSVIDNKVATVIFEKMKLQKKKGLKGGMVVRFLMEKLRLEEIDDGQRKALVKGIMHRLSECRNAARRKTLLNLGKSN